MFETCPPLFFGNKCQNEFTFSKKEKTAHELNFVKAQMTLQLYDTASEDLKVKSFGCLPFFETPRTRKGSSSKPHLPVI